MGWARRPGAPIVERPWFVLLGGSPPDRRRLLENLGSSSRLRQAQRQAARSGVSTAVEVDRPGLDGWVFDEATVLEADWIGAEPPSDAGPASNAWERLLSRIAALRARRAIDGVILLADAADLLHEGAAVRDARNARWRQALGPVRSHAQAPTPVFLVVAGIDRLEGFAETFADLEATERGRPWGVDLSRDDEPSAANAGAASRFMQAFARLDDALRTRCIERIDASADPRTRAAIFMFAQEFAGLAAVLGDVVGGVTPSGDAPGDGVRVQGVYFAGSGRAAESACADGPDAASLSTPTSRALAQQFGIEVTGPSTASAADAGQASTGWFLGRLLGDVLLAEPGLQRRRSAARQRRSQWRWGGYAVLAVAATALVAAWLVSFSRNLAYVAEVRTRPVEIRRSIDALPPAVNGDVTPLPAVLSAVRNLAAPGGFPVDQPPLLNGFGLYQGDKLDVAATIGYEHLLDHALMPRLSHRLQERLQAAGSDNLEQAYEALKSYLMVYTPDKFDAESLRAWIRADWDDASGARLPPDRRAALDRHLDALLKRGAPKAVVPIDMALVNRTRDMLKEYPLENRVYSRLKRLNASTSLPDFTLAGAAGPMAASVFARASGQAITRGIPGLYTRDGYTKAFQSSIEPLALQIANEESWVLGIGASDGRGGVAGAVNAAEAAAKRAREMAGGQLSNRVRRLYFDDFIRQWDAYIADMRLANVDSLEKARLLAQALSGTDSPLLSLMRAVARETTLTVPASLSGRTAALSTALDKAAASRNEAARLSGTEPSASDAGAPSGQVERVVDDHFATFHRLVDGKRAPIEQSLRLFDRVNAQLSDIDLAQRRRTPLPAPTGLVESRLAAAGQPEPIRSMLQTLVGTGLSALSVAPASAAAPGATRPARSP
jgi:type VI secretion system protein ImpL